MMTQEVHDANRSWRTAASPRSSPAAVGSFRCCEVVCGTRALAPRLLYLQINKPCFPLRFAGSVVLSFEQVSFGRKSGVLGPEGLIYGLDLKSYLPP